MPPAGLLQLARLARRWGQEKKMGPLTAKLRDARSQATLRTKRRRTTRVWPRPPIYSLWAATKLSLNALLEQIGPQAGPALTSGIFDVLANSTSDAVGSALVKRWTQLTPAGKASAVDLLLKRAAWTNALLDGVEKGGVDKGDFSVEQAQRLSKYPERRDRPAGRNKLLAGSGVLSNPDRQKVVDLFAPALKRHGDAVKGKAVFEKNCAKCHRHGDIGNVIGPDLTGMAVRERADLLIDILDPNRSVEGNYRQYSVLTKDGRVMTGLLLSETKTNVELLDSEAKKHDVLREDIDEFKSTKLSLMPDGFEKLGQDDILAVLEFLTVRDKFFPLPLGKAATITSVRGMFISKDGRGATADLSEVGSANGVRRAVPGHRPARRRHSERDRVVRPRRCRVEGDAEVRDGAVQRFGQGDPPAGRRRRLGLAVRQEGNNVDDCAPALRRRQDGGPRIAQRRSDGGLHP